MSASSQPTILLVDDDATARYLICRCLTEFPLLGQVLEAENGQQALALVEAYCQSTTAPHSLLILLDLNMPVMGGLEFLERHLHLPSVCQQVASVVVISATPSETERGRARQLAVTVKPKPVTMELLTELVRQYLPTALAY
jgi:CheY-like chemotaxis protein